MITPLVLEVLLYILQSNWFYFFSTEFTTNFSFTDMANIVHFLEMVQKCVYLWHDIYNV